MVKNTLFVALGVLSLCIGGLGTLLPILPTTPFLVLASFLFIKGSPRIQKWFEGTSLYRKHLITLKEKKGLTFKTKLRILLPFYFIMAYGIAVSDNRTMKMIFLALVFIKTALFVKIKTISQSKPLVQGKIVQWKADQAP
jgi:uncharacterized membrane protein YbaN (DUF454 family)